MAESEKPFQIGELARRTGTSIRMIRYFDKHGLISTPDRKRADGYRLFTEHHVAEVQWIRKMQGLGFSLAEIKPIRDVESSSVPGNEKVRAMQAIFLGKLKVVEDQIAHLQAVEKHLRDWSSLRPPR